MISVSTKACSACAKFKRKCDKQLPSCNRCARKGLTCAYSALQRQRPAWALRQNAYAFSPASEDSHRVGAAPSDNDDIAAPSPSTNFSYGLPPPESTPSSFSPPSPSLTDLQSAWFLVPESWQVVRFLGNLPNRLISPDMLDDWTRTFQTWIDDWLTQGRNGFVHRHLYISRIPPVIRDVFTVLASYKLRTPATEPMVFRIIDSRIKELVASEASEAQEEQLDVLGHLSRLQALVAYLAIGLFSSNIRLRHTAELQLHLLVTWAQKMQQAAAHAAGNGQLLLSQVRDAPRVVNGDDTTGEQHREGELQDLWHELGLAERETTLWRTWILAESVRRTWLVARAIESLYLLLRDDVTVCPGGLMFTMRKGAWEAVSAFAWAEICGEKDPIFLDIGQTDKLCMQPGPEVLDEFAKFIIQINFRTERTRRWMMGEGDG